MIVRCTRGLRPAQMPIGMPISERERDRGQHQRERLDARLPQPHQGERGERGEHDEPGPQAAEAGHDQRAGHGDAEPRHPQQRVRERVDHPLRERAEPVEDREDDVGVGRRALVDQPALEVVELPGERGPDQPARPRDLPARDDEGQQHEREHAQDLHGAAAPPPGGRRDRRSGDAPASDRHPRPRRRRRPSPGARTRGRRCRRRVRPRRRGRCRTPRPPAPRPSRSCRRPAPAPS